MTSNPQSPVYAEAEACDARGAHDEAVNILARATQAGDHLAKTRLGKRLLVGDRAPYLPKEGAEFILEAAQDGIAEAVSMVAVFQATGIYQPKDWSIALDTLCHAAVLGAHSAREQLLLLSPAVEPAEMSELLGKPDAQYWRKVKEGISLDTWLQEVPGQTLNEDPLIKTFSEILPGPICQWLVRRSKKKLQPALVYDAENQRNVQSTTRTNSIAEFNLAENEFLNFLIQQKMSAACGIPMQQMEGTAILNYQPGEEISPHYDFVDPSMDNYEEEVRTNGQRIITFLIYLNEAYEGGETVFTELGISFKGSTGDGIYFVNSLPDNSADTRTRHAGTPTTSGEKWILSQFIRNRSVNYVLV
jgi:prolyl 4-hydroxylase